MNWIDYDSLPIIIGHRGALNSAPENTIVSFDLALKQGADGFELDTMLSADGVPVVIHDRSVDRTTYGSGRVDRLPVRDLQRLDAGSSFSREFKNERIPLLEDVFIKYKGRVLINVELKNYQNPFDALPEKVIELASKTRMMEQLLFSSFLPAYLIRIRRINPAAHVALITSNRASGKILNTGLFTSLSAEYIHPNHADCSLDFIQKQHRRKTKVNAWTVNNAETIEKMIQYGIDGIITDEPDLAARIKQDKTIG